MTKQLKERIAKEWAMLDPVDPLRGLLSDVIAALAQPERHELQAKGEHPAPCARFCEANAFRIVERGYQRQIRELQASLAQDEQSSSQEPVEDVVAYHSDGTRTVRIAPKRPWVGLTKANMQVLIEQARVVPKQAPCPDYNERLLMLTNAVLQELNT